jgi:hypothetical protein
MNFKELLSKGTNPPGIRFVEHLLETGNCLPLGYHYHFFVIVCVNIM